MQITGSQEIYGVKSVRDVKYRVGRLRLWTAELSPLEMSRGGLVSRGATTKNIYQKNTKGNI